MFILLVFFFFWCSIMYWQSFFFYFLYFLVLSYSMHLKNVLNGSCCFCLPHFLSSMIKYLFLTVCVIYSVCFPYASLTNIFLYNLIASICQCCCGEQGLENRWSGCPAISSYFCRPEFPLSDWRMHWRLSASSPGGCGGVFQAR